MGLSMRWEDEKNNSLGEVADPRNLLHGLLPEPDDESYQCLRFVDWYGDTSFNYLQMPALITDLERLRGRAKSAADLELIESIKDLAKRCSGQSGTHIKFIGD